MSSAQGGARRHIDISLQRDGIDVPAELGCDMSRNTDSAISRQWTDSQKAGPPLEEAMARWQDELLGTLYVLLGVREEAEQAFREVFLKCWRHREELAEVEDIKTWIFRTAIQTARDRRATAWRRRFRLWNFEAEPFEASPAEVSTDPQQSSSEEVVSFRRALMALPPEEQEVFLLRQNAQMDYEQMAVVLRIPVDAVKKRMCRALVQLQQTLQAQSASVDEESSSSGTSVLAVPESSTTQGAEVPTGTETAGLPVLPTSDSPA